jgi:hypothetical protein
MLQQNKSVFPCQAFSCLSNEVSRNDQLPKSLTDQSQPTHGAIKKPTRTQNLQKVDSLGPFLVRPCLIFVSKQVYRSLIRLHCKVLHSWCGSGHTIKKDTLKKLEGQTQDLDFWEAGSLTKKKVIKLLTPEVVQAEGR